MKQKIAALLTMGAAIGVLTACGGGGSLPDSIENSVSPASTVEAAPGRGVTATASAKALRNRVVDMQWTLERMEGSGGSDLVAANADCASSTMAFNDNLGKGKCVATILIPQDANPGLWRVSNTAVNEDGDMRNAAFSLRVVEAPQTGFILHVPTVPIVYSLGELATIHAHVSTPTQLGLNPLVHYEWEQLSGPSVALTGANTRTVTFAPTTPGEYEFKVTAETTINGILDRESRTTVVIVRDPVLDRFVLSAGEAQVVHPESPVFLNGLLVGNEQLFLPSVQFEWRQISGPSVFLSNANSMTASFIPAAAGNFVFELTATTTQYGETFVTVAQTQVLVVEPEEELPEPPAPDLTAFTVSTAPAPVTALVNATVNIPSTVTFPADVTATNVVRQWTQNAGPTASIANANSDTMTFVPVLPGQYSFVVTVTATINGEEVTRTNTAVVIVEDPNVGSPVVSAGDAQVVDAGAGASVSLNGSVTYPAGMGPDAPASFMWSQVAGPSSIIYNGTTATPSVLLQEPGTYTYFLTVDGVYAGQPFSKTAHTAVLVVAGDPAPSGEPIVSAGAPQVIEGGEPTTVTLAATVTFPQGVSPDTPPTYTWTQVAGPGSILHNDRTLTAYVVLETVGTYTYQFEVSGTINGVPFTKTATTAVHVTAP